MNARQVALGVAVALFMLVMQTASAQVQPTARSGASSLSSLLVNEQVLKELGIEPTSEQAAGFRQRWEAIRKEHREVQLALDNDTPKVELREATAKIDEKYDAELKDKLTQEQFTRLQQLHWQQGGPEVYVEPAVVTALGITREQLEKIFAWIDESERFQTAFNEKMAPLFKQMRDATASRTSAEETQKQIKEAAEELNKSTTEGRKKLNEILTKEQQEKFTAMKGAIFVPQRRMPASIRVGGMMSLALTAPVQKELGLAADAPEIAEIRKLLQAAQQEVQQAVRDAGLNAIQNPMSVEAALESKFDPQMEKLLKPEQFARLRQINWQHAGIRALYDPEIVKQLQITQEQHSRIAALNMEIFQKRLKLAQDPDVKKKTEELMEERQKGINEILSAAQQAKLSELKGPAFDLSQLRPTN